MRGSYSIPLVLLSYVVAVLASHVTLSLAQRLRPTDGARATHQPLYWPWIVGGAFSMGIGIWSMHFIGMLAFDLPVQVVYDLRLTAMSYVIAVVVSGAPEPYFPEVLELARQHINQSIRKLEYEEIRRLIQSSVSFLQ
jgi:NO-binding membrane sensor protein with MHYT domain